MKVKESLSEKQIGAIEAVQRINNEIHDKFGWNSDHPVLSVSIAGWYLLINISIGSQELLLYSSEDDDRIYYEKSDKYEEWYSYIKRKFREVKEEIEKVKL